jgi:hypothetical protein
MQKFLFPLSAAALFLGQPAAHAQVAPPPSPVGPTWDCALGGNQLGLAIIRFDDDFQLLRPNPAAQTPKVDVDPRGGGGGAGRDGTPPAALPPTPPTNFVGGTAMSGRWGYDIAGKTIGLLDQVSTSVKLVDKMVTNDVLVTNIIGGIVVVTSTNLVYTTNVYETVYETNAVSFRAVVVPGRRLTLTAFVPGGQNTYRGLPSVPLSDLSGELYAGGKRAGLQFYEFLSAVPSGKFPNYYYLDGSGAGYMYHGFAIVSRHKRIAVETETDTLPSVISTYSGPYNLVTRRGRLYGRDTDGKNSIYMVVHQ